MPTRVDVAAGEDASQIAMDQWVSDPDGDDPAGMTYTITDKQVDGVSASASGSTLSVSANAEAPKGQAGQLTIEVTDQQGASASASVPVNVIASSKPLVQTSPGQITLKAGESKTVDVSEYATNPLADQGPLTIMGDPATSAGGSATASGSTMTIQADAGFNGSFTVTYRVQDATKDVEREVQGTITATVLDKPGAPTGASAVSNSAGTALVSWRTGTTGGSPITSFTVTDHNQCTEAKVTATLDHLRDTVNRHYTLDVLVIGIVVATVRVTAIIIAAIPATFPTFVLGGFSGFACKFLLFFSHVFLLTGSIRPRGHLQLQPPHGRGTCYHHGRKRQSLFRQPWRARQSACRPAGL